MNNLEQDKLINQISGQLKNALKDLETLKLGINELKMQPKTPTQVTLDDIYKAFGDKKKHYAIRLKHAFLEHHVETIDDLMSLSLYDIANMDGIGSETLRLLITKLNNLGIDYHPTFKK